MVQYRGRPKMRWLIKNIKVVGIKCEREVNWSCVLFTSLHLAYLWDCYQNYYYVPTWDWITELWRVPNYKTSFISDDIYSAVSPCNEVENLC